MKTPDATKQFDLLSMHVCYWYPHYLDGILKRAIDIIVCLLIIVPACLVMLFIILVVLIIDGRPAIFLQNRTGKNGVTFKMPKIRTLTNQAHPNTPSHCCDIKAFAFPLSKIIRKYRLDELPQIFTIIIGKMSLVGPRPALPHVVKEYTRKERRRLNAKPGLTGLWQISAPRNVPIHTNVKYDLYYLRKAGISLDMKILAGTILFLIRA